MSRYHMASRMANGRMFQVWFIYLVVGTVASVLCALCTIMFIAVHWYKSSFGPVVDICFNPDYSQAGPQIWLGPAFALTSGVVGLIIGIIYDLAMFRFLQKRRKNMINPSFNMAQWKAERSSPPLISQSIYCCSCSLPAAVQLSCAGIWHWKMVGCSWHQH